MAHLPGYTIKRANYPPSLRVLDSQAYVVLAGAVKHHCTGLSELNPQVLQLQPPNPPPQSWGRRALYFLLLSRCDLPLLPIILRLCRYFPIQAPVVSAAVVAPK
ncbi:hypothetical protein [Desulforamulus aquiferis]|uniref:hypothetical protein n=1 Tax=Desulforamulus aquiferis TaxID=1397668 RepID=UPI00271557BB|nr:hypothetical protein [Desulforamulus aquiferis]